MHIHELRGKTICILGFGREGRAMLDALMAFAPKCEVTIADQKEGLTLPEGSPHWLQVGTGWLHNLGKFDVIIKSPGIPPLPELTPHHAKITTPTQIFLDTVAGTGATVIGVTGSKGKSTTASLIAAVLKDAGKDVHLVGNIGEPAIAHLLDAKPGTLFVEEMSSYQLMDLTRSPHIAVLTSFFPEHLDYHKSLNAYRDAKTNIAAHQGESDLVFYPADSKDCHLIAQRSAGRKIPYYLHDTALPLGETHLLGSHNLSNIAAVTKVCLTLDVPLDTIEDAIRAFPGLPHRLQSLGVHGGLEWVDDSISTAPESAMAALEALGDRVHTVILGGLDRGYDFTELGKRLIASHVHAAILLPESGPKIAEAIRAAGTRVHCYNAGSMEEAVALAYEHTQSKSGNPIVLLSPASPSYGLFENFEDRGEQFKKAILSGK